VDDTAYLRKTWLRIKEASTRQPPATLLHQDLNLHAARAARPGGRRDAVDPHRFARAARLLLTTFAAEFMPDTVASCSTTAASGRSSTCINIDEDIARALSRRVDLKSGGYLVIDQTEALTTVDVNTGGFVGARNFDDTVYRTNLEAAQAIARQLRLRNLGGIVIVDFIDMVRDDHRERCFPKFRKQLARDRVKTMTGGFSQLGLVEMTRKRTRESLAHMLSESCVACSGRGVVKTARSVCYDILREILREARAFNPREFRVVASPKVIELFLDEERAHLAGLSDFIGKPISLQSESSMTQEQYDIVLL
jgi:ribonuclease G